MQNVYHKPGLPAAGHLIFADSPHCRFLPYPSVKSREQTQSKFSLLNKAVFLLFAYVCFLIVCLFKKTIFGNTFKILCSLSWIQAPAPEDGKPPLPPKSFTTPTSATGLTGPQGLLPVPWSFLYISSVQSLSHVQLFSISWDPVFQVSLSITNSQILLRLMFIRSVMPPNSFIFCLPLCLLPLIFPCIRVFSHESVLRINWPKYWRFSFGIGPSSEYPGLISFSMNWLNLLVVHRTLKSLIQHHILKPSILWYSAFFMVHLSHPLTISGKTIALTIQTSAGNVMSLLFSVLYGIS